VAAGSAPRHRKQDRSGKVVGERSLVAGPPVSGASLQHDSSARLLALTSSRVSSVECRHNRHNQDHKHRDRGSRDPRDHLSHWRPSSDVPPRARGDSAAHVRRCVTSRWTDPDRSLSRSSSRRGEDLSRVGFFWGANDGIQVQPGNAFYMLYPRGRRRPEESRLVRRDSAQISSCLVGTLSIELN